MDGIWSAMQKNTIVLREILNRTMQLKNIITSAPRPVIWKSEHYRAMSYCYSGYVMV